MNSMVTIFCLWTLCNGLVKALIVTYEEIQQLGLGCYPKDSCKEPRTEDYPGISWSYSCSCDRLCSQFDTCCVDSYYNSVKQSAVRPSCRSVNMMHAKTAYYMVDRCLSNDNSESAWGKLCNEEWTTEDDLMRLIPVTSLFTFVTYKNYFCFRCYENTDDYSYWRVWLVGKSSQYLQPASDRTLQYRDDEKTLTVTFSDKNVSIPVDLKFDIPFEIGFLPVECVAGIISNCSHNWHDRAIRDKCQTYTGIVFVERGKTILKYKNVHCALCNFESTENIGCKTYFDRSYGAQGVDEDIFSFVHYAKANDKGKVEKSLFSFTDLLDVDRSDGDRVGKNGRRCRDNFIWDPYRSSCRPLVCPLPRYVVRKNRCVKI